ncbi:ATP-binding cassette domain-containing protein, partial [Streptococcus pyogenes]
HDLKEDLSNKAETAQLEINFETSRIGKKVVEFEHVNFSYPGKPIVQDFSLLIKNADRIGIVGDNGKGKSTLLNLIAGQ